MRLTLTLALLLTLAACAPASAATPVNLRITVSDGKTSKSARLVCRSDGTNSKSGFLKGSTRGLCRTARRLARFLDTPPDRTRVCTQATDGPDRAWVRGRIGSRSIDRRFARNDGCAIADFDKADALFVGGPSSPERDDDSFG